MDVVQIKLRKKQCITTFANANLRRLCKRSCVLRL